MIVAKLSIAKEIAKKRVARRPLDLSISVSSFTRETVRPIRVNTIVVKAHRLLKNMKFP